MNANVFTLQKHQISIKPKKNNMWCLMQQSDLLPCKTGFKLKLVNKKYCSSERRTSAQEERLEQPSALNNMLVLFAMWYKICQSQIQRLA